MISIRIPFLIDLTKGKAHLIKCLHFTLPFSIILFLLFGKENEKGAWIGSENILHFVSCIGIIGWVRYKRKFEIPMVPNVIEIYHFYMNDFFFFVYILYFVCIWIQKEFLRGWIKAFCQQNRNLCHRIWKFTFIKVSSSSDCQVLGCETQLKMNEMVSWMKDKSKIGLQFIICWELLVN